MDDHLVSAPPISLSIESSESEEISPDIKEEDKHYDEIEREVKELKIVEDSVSDDSKIDFSIL